MLRPIASLGLASLLLGSLCACGLDDASSTSEDHTAAELEQLLAEAPPADHPAKGAPLEEHDFAGFFTLETLKSNDPQFPKGYQAAGRATVDVSRNAEGLYADFSWESRAPMLHYNYGTQVEPGATGGFVFPPSQQAMFILYADSCTNLMWEELVETMAQGQGSAGGLPTGETKASITVAIKRTVYHFGNQGMCDPPPEGEYKRLVRINVVEATECVSDQDCAAAGESCNASEVCLPPPGCQEGQPCAQLCYGWCN